MITLLHTGDIGDIIASLPILRANGGGRIVITETKERHPLRKPRESLRGRRLDALKPLLEAQEYVTKVIWANDPDEVRPDLSLCLFRTMKPKPMENLAEWQARFCGTKISLDPWLRVPDPGPSVSEGHIAIARSPRYHNFFFPWKQLFWHFRQDDIIFLGLPSEHEAFEQIVQRRIDYVPTGDLLQLAQWISRAKLFIGNQSSPFWIAAGLGVAAIQESFDRTPNSVVLRDNIIYTLTPPDTRTLMLKLERGQLESHPA